MADKLPLVLNTNGVIEQLQSGDILVGWQPSQAGHTGEFLTTNGTVTAWASIREVTAGGVSGQVLTTDGSVYSWEDAAEEVADQSGHSGAFLTTNGTVTSWDAIREVTAGGTNGQVLTTDGSGYTWEDAPASTDTLDDVCDRGATTDQTIHALAFSATSRVYLSHDDAKIAFGDSNDYDACWDGSAAVHTISSGWYEFNGGPFRLPVLTTTERDAVTPIDGMQIYNSTANQFQRYENGGWGSWSSSIATNASALAALDLQDVCDNSASTTTMLYAAGFSTTGHYHSLSDAAKHYFGAGDDYQIYYDGTDVIHYLVGGTGSFKFENGALGVPQMNDTQKALWITAPYEGMLIFNLTSHVLEVYSGTSWKDVDTGGSALPDQSGHTGEFLTTDGSDASWTSIRQVTAGGTNGQVLTTDGSGYTWEDAPASTDTLDDVCDRGATTDQVIIAASFSTAGNVNVASNTNGLRMGTGAEYIVGWDGTNVNHTVTSGSHTFNGGPIQLPSMTTAVRDALTPADGMLIYNSTVDEFQSYENGAWTTGSHNVVITADTDVYITTSGSDTTGDGSSGNPWATIDKALSVIGEWIILAILNINVEKGSYSGSGDINFNHLQASKIQILGDYAVKTSLALTSSGGSAGAWTYTFNMSDTSDFTLNDYVVVYAASGGTDPERLLGVLKVTAITINTSVTLTSTLSLATGASGAVSVDLSIPQVKWARRITFNTSPAIFYGVQTHLAGSGTSDYFYYVSPTLPGVSSFRYCAWINTAASNYGVGVRVNGPSACNFTYCGGYHLSSFVFTSFLAYTNIQYGVSQECTFGVRGYTGSGFILTCSFIEDTYGMYATYMSMFALGGTQTYVNSTTTDTSPAIGIQGNQNSWIE